MKNYYWLKLHFDMLDDWKLGTLTDELKWRFIQCLLVAGEAKEEGFLPHLKQFAHRIRPISPDKLETDLATLSDVGLVELKEDSEGQFRWFVTNYKKRQAKVEAKDRMRAMRERQRTESLERSYDSVTEPLRERYEDVTTRNTDKIRIDKKREEIYSPSPDGTYVEFLTAWSQYFPEKSQPRSNNKTLQGKLKTRMKCEHFKLNWMKALDKAAQSDFLHNGTFFDAGWFLQNDNNWEKCLNGNYANRQNGQHPQQKKTKFQYTGEGGRM